MIKKTKVHLAYWQTNTGINDQLGLVRQLFG